MPITVNVWGVREAVATELLPLGGIDPAQGVAATVVFGPACMAAALAGLVPWLMADRRDTSAHSGDTQAALAIQLAEWDNF